MKRTASVPAALVAAGLFMAGMVGIAHAAYVPQSYLNEPVVNASCSTASCGLLMYTGSNAVTGISTKKIYVHTTAPVFGCDKWGIVNGTKVSASGVATKLQTKHSYVSSASGTIKEGLFLNPVAYGSTDPNYPDYLRCRTYQDF